VDTDDKSPANGVDRFCTTRWSAVLLSAQSELPGSQAALAELCKIYWYPIYTFVRRRGYGPDDAEDLTQGFFLHLLDHKALRQVSPVKGKFRSFLAASLQNYLLDRAEHAQCLKQVETSILFLLMRTLPSIVVNRQTRFLTAGKIFDARWAIRCSTRQ
jgi:RNA polymerase sigma-70 factor (ECF subfamily)